MIPVYLAVPLLIVCLGVLVWFALHQRSMLFVKVAVNGGAYVVPLTDIGIVFAEVRNLHPDDTLVVEIVSLRWSEFERMPEFEGW